MINVTALVQLKAFARQNGSDMDSKFYPYDLYPTVFVRKLVGTIHAFYSWLASLRFSQLRP